MIHLTFSCVVYLVGIARFRQQGDEDEPDTGVNDGHGRSSLAASVRDIVGAECVE